MGLIIATIFIAIVIGLLWRDIMTKQAPANDPTKVVENWPFPDAENPAPFPTGKKP
jgi:hypothetical protein